MTAKRFRFNGRTNCIEYDNKSILLDSYGEDIEELLNELHEENQKCKEYNAILYSNTAKNEKELLKENEQLKDSVMSWSKSYKRLSEENDGLRIKIRKLRLEKIHQNKENERLRKCINEIYTIARLEEVD